MRIIVLGGGPAGLYAALLIKKSQPAAMITVYERNPAGATYGFGVVFSDRTLAAFQEADARSYKAITESFVLWDAIDIRYRDTMMRCGGHVIAGIARQRLLGILQGRCRELGVELVFEHEIADLSELPPHDLLIGADGLNGLTRRVYEAELEPRIVLGHAKYIWLGTDKLLDAFTFIFRENEHGLFQVHAYPFAGERGTFIVECAEDVWERAGLARATEAESLAYCERLFAPDLAGAQLFSNRSGWMSFPTLTTRHWHTGNVVLLGDAIHTAHFSIGSGTKLAMEDAIALARVLEQQPSLPQALADYQLTRQPVVQTLQAAAAESRVYFENMKRYLRLDPPQFAFQLLTRSGRVTYDDLRTRDAGFVRQTDLAYTQASGAPVASALALDEPISTPLHIAGLTLPNRVAALAEVATDGHHGLPGPGFEADFVAAAQAGPALLLASPVAVSAAGRVSVVDAGLYADEHIAAWKGLATQARAAGATAVGIVLSHAGRRGAAHAPSLGDMPLPAGSAWPLLAPSAIAYEAGSQTPREMSEPDMAQIIAELVAATKGALQAGADVLGLHMAHGFLLGSFLSPLSNRRGDSFGGDIQRRLRFPLEALDAVRSEWPSERPLLVALNVTDCAHGGVDPAEAVIMARALREHGADMLWALAGHTVAGATPPYGAGFLTRLSDQLRNDSGVPVMVGGHLTNANAINTVLAAGRADLCIASRAMIRDATAQLAPRQRAEGLMEQNGRPVGHRVKREVIA
ncbi:MAG TPA: FAD-dependent monooxygenase [Ktedonobacterales bacterium]